MSSVISNKLKASKARDLYIDVLAPLRMLLLESLETPAGSSSYVQRLRRLLGSGAYYKRIFAGGLQYQLRTGDEYGIILFTQVDSDTSWSDNIVTDYCRMLCFGGSKNLDGKDIQGIETSILLRDAACSILRAVTNKLVPSSNAENGRKLIYSIGVGSDRTRLDTGSSRSYSDIELTVVSNILRQR